MENFQAKLVVIYIMQQFEIRRGSQVVKKGKTCVFGQNKTRLKRLNENMKPCIETDCKNLSQLNVSVGFPPTKKKEKKHLLATTGRPTPLQEGETFNKSSELMGYITRR